MVVHISIAVIFIFVHVVIKKSFIAFQIALAVVEMFVHVFVKNDAMLFQAFVTPS